MVTDNLQPARALFEQRDTIVKNCEERCDLLAQYFKGMAGTLQQVVARLKENEVSQSKIAEITTYAEPIPEAVGKGLPLR